LLSWKIKLSTLPIRLGDVEGLDKGEVKIYDTLGYSDEADWVKVHNSNHNFVETSDLIIQNSLYRWTLDLSAIWENTGEFKNLYTEDVGYLYNYAYKYDSIKWYIKEIRPDYVEILFHFTRCILQIQQQQIAVKPAH